MNKIINTIGWDIIPSDDMPVFGNFNPNTLTFKHYSWLKTGDIDDAVERDIDGWPDDINDMFDVCVVGIVEATIKGERYQLHLNGLSTFILCEIQKAPTDSAAAKVTDYVNDAINRINAICEKVRAAIANQPCVKSEAAKITECVNDAINRLNAIENR